MRGVVHSSDEPEESDRYPGKSYIDFLLRDARNRGICVRVVEFSNQMPMIEKNQVAVLRNAKVCVKSFTLQSLCNAFLTAQSVHAFKVGNVELQHLFIFVF